MAPVIYWDSPEHKQRFSTAVQDMHKVYQGKIDPEYGAAIYILTASAHMWDQAKSYARTKQDRLDIEEMVKHIDLTGGSYVLTHLAGNLFNENLKVDPAQFAYRLDEENYQIAISAIHIRRYGLRIDDLKDQA